MGCLSDTYTSHTEYFLKSLLQFRTDTGGRMWKSQANSLTLADNRQSIGIISRIFSDDFLDALKSSDVLCLVVTSVDEDVHLGALRRALDRKGFGLSFCDRFAYDDVVGNRIGQNLGVAVFTIYAPRDNHDLIRLPHFASFFV